MCGTNMPLVTVMVPVYNVEKYLERCLDSIVNQTYRNLEIILVNDGSTDRSEEICRRYKERDSRVFLYSQENQGQAVARNVCLDHAHGKYLVFVDSDDYLSLSFIEILLRALFEKDVSLSVCDYDCPGAEDGEIATIYPGKQIPWRMMSRDDVYNTLNSRHGSLRFEALWGKIYRKEIFEGIRFPSGKSAEDTFAYPKIYHQVEKICCTDLKLYHYVQSQNSVLRKNGIVDRPNLDYAEADFELLAYFSEHGKKRHVRTAASRVIRDVINWYDHLGMSKREVCGHIKEAEEKIFSMTGKRFLTSRLIIYKLSPNLYRFTKRTWKLIRARKYK